ncbi:MAG TPA: hypothetical protein VFN61_02240 [Acidimicrobiales bacterium]|nr:hypothetical protein [Acidimicrobiales bacterium]
MRRLGSATGTSFSYKTASQLPIEASGEAQDFDSASELCWSATRGTSGTGCNSPPSAATTYSYDAEGERAGATAPSISASYSWDEARQLASATSPDGSASASYTYGAQGLLASRTAGQTSTAMLWDANAGSLPELVYDGTSYYIYGPDGLPIEQTSAPGCATAYPLRRPVRRRRS